MSYQLVFSDAFTDTPFVSLTTHDATHYSDVSPDGPMRIGTSGARLNSIGTCRVLLTNLGTPSQPVKAEVKLYTFIVAGKGPMVHVVNSSNTFWGWVGYFAYVTNGLITVYRGDNDGGGDSIGTRVVSLSPGDTIGITVDASGNVSVLLNDVQQGATIADGTYTSGDFGLMIEATEDDWGDDLAVYEWVDAPAAVMVSRVSLL